MTDRHSPFRRHVLALLAGSPAVCSIEIGRTGPCGMNRTPTKSAPWVVAGFLAAAYAAALWLTGARVEESALDALADSGSRQLNLLVTHLDGRLRKYEFLPELVARGGGLEAALATPRDAQAIDALNRRLAEVRRISGAGRRSM